MKKVWYIFIVFLSLYACGKDGVYKKRLNSFEIVKEYKRGPITVTLKIDKKSISIAETLHLVLDVRVKDGYEAYLPEFGDKLEQFEIVSYNFPGPRLVEKDLTLYIRSYELEPFLSGEYKIPPLTVAFAKEGESKTKRHEIITEEIIITVTSLLPKDNSKPDLYDIRPPVILPAQSNIYLYIMIIVSIVIISIFVINFWKRNRRDRESPTILSPHETAYRQLEDLISQDLLKKGRVKKFYQVLSHILRDYIERRFSINASERTTEEFLSELRYTSILDSTHKSLLKNFLDHCDLVKFAEHSPSEKEIESAFDACKKFISETELSEALDG